MDDLGMNPQELAAFPIVVFVLARVAAELLVNPSIHDGMPALQAFLSLPIFYIVLHILLSLSCTL